MFLLPQLEGIDQKPASEALFILRQFLDGWTPDAGLSALEERFTELFPHLKEGQ